MAAEESVKTCKKCGAEKPLEEFAVVKAKGQSYRRGQCKECIKKWFKDERPSVLARRAKRPKAASVPDRECARPWSELMGE